MRLAQEEIFGPVLAAIPFASYEEAVRIANGVRYGLTASVWTRDLACAHAFARDVEAGYVWVNDSSRHFLGTPFGGIRHRAVHGDGPQLAAERPRCVFCPGQPSDLQ
jgi:acyl-CoA reductase-like NAD-dependent aldehyde dehydrogenase